MLCNFLFQILTCVVISAWTVVVVLIQFLIIDKMLGLRLSIEEEFLGADVIEHDLHYRSDETSRKKQMSKVTKRNIVEPISPILELKNHRSTTSYSDDQDLPFEKRVISREEDEAEMEIENELIRRTKDEPFKRRPRKQNVKIIVTPPSRQGNNLF